VCAEKRSNKKEEEGIKKIHKAAKLTLAETEKRCKLEYMYFVPIIKYFFFAQKKSASKIA